MWGSKNRVASVGLIGHRDIAGPLSLMIACPLLTLCIAGLLRGLSFESGALACESIYVSTDGLKMVARTLFGFALANLALLKFLMPSLRVLGPVTPGGQRPEYADNGVHALLLNVIGFVFFSDIGALSLYPIDIWSVYLVELLLLTNVVSFAFCFWLYVRTQTRRTPDFSTRGKFVTDFYTGNELHPTFFNGVDIKQFTNCRFGMMLWPLMVVSAAGCEYRSHGNISRASIVAYALQLAYLVKFFLWEKGYFYTLDMMHDRAGFYLCWGCMNWVPCVYALVASFHGVAQHHDDMSCCTMVSFLMFGLACLFCNYHSDLQRKQFREAGSASYSILGKPANFIEATYTTEDGHVRTNRLLTSGYWGTSRHFNYTAELAFSFTVGLTTAFVGQGVVGVAAGLFYPTFLTVLLVDRCYRDEARCSSKYGKFWGRYCEEVPYRLIPGVY